MSMKTYTKIKSCLTSKYYNNENDLVVGKMKDETIGVLLKRFVGSKSKLHTFVTEDNHDSKQVKGINDIFVNDELKYEDYKNVLLNRSYMKHEMNRNQSKNHNIALYRIKKGFFVFLR